MIEHVLIAGLAGFRLASMLVNEDGPYHIFTRFRAFVGAPNTDEFGEIREGLIPDILRCLWCAGVWTSAAMFALYFLTWTIPGVFAAMSVAILAHRLLRQEQEAQ